MSPMKPWSPSCQLLSLYRYAATMIVVSPPIASIGAKCLLYCDNLFMMMVNLSSRAQLLNEYLVVPDCIASHRIALHRLGLANLSSNQFTVCD
ncbi:hypothetical protein E2P81_ATG09124 [Venturia nashicola]|uniref:Uncharacterized protein n=1 Tax=Venturia nashicola TaxID=86259 RepID=A0A4Z1P1U1_9PEZI|nr:hypothetical protein E6O75_ATG09325 [Venturia nashicola]TLD20054.1 hypothetical protein E2P81_ATG09124 [Venturia nashicola]